MKKKNIVGLFLSLFALSLFSVGFYKYFEKESRSPKEQIVQMWMDDIHGLAPKLPPSWKSIAEVSLSYGDLETQVFFTNLNKAPVKTNPKGEYRLEVTIISDDQKHFIFQHNMIHKPTNEMLWELGRTYQLPIKGTHD